MKDSSLTAGTPTTVRHGNHGASYELPTAVMARLHGRRILMDLRLRAVIMADQTGWKLLKLDEDDLWAEFVETSITNQDTEDIDEMDVKALVDDNISGTSSYKEWYVETIVSFLNEAY